MISILARQSRHAASTLWSSLRTTPTNLLASRPHTAHAIPSAQHRSVNDEAARNMKPITEMTEEEQIRLLREDGIAPATGRPLKEIEAEIWDYNTSPTGAGNRSGLKVLQKPLKGPLYASWYPEPDSKNPHNPFRLTDKQERWRAKLKILRASGKGPPKKGAGKRSK